MSNERSPRAVCSTTIGTRGMDPPRGSDILQPCGCTKHIRAATLWLRVRLLWAIKHAYDVKSPTPGPTEAPMTDQIERELLLPATPKEVWDVITGPGWLAEAVQLELVPGGHARFASGEELKTGWVEEALVPRTAADTGRLVFWWAG